MLRSLPPSPSDPVLDGANVAAPVSRHNPNTQPDEAKPFGPLAPVLGGEGWGERSSPAPHGRITHPSSMPMISQLPAQSRPTLISWQRHSLGEGAASAR